MKQKFIIEVSFSAMNEMSLCERLRDAVFEWQTTEPKVKSVSVVPAQEKAESLPTGLQHGQPKICPHYFEATIFPSSSVIVGRCNCNGKLQA
jgi:hypothetical protein